jgi:hypothetical protein
MYTISNISKTQSGVELELCLHCKKTVATDPVLGTLEVTDEKGGLRGFLHPRCKAAWEEAQPKVADKGRVGDVV